MAQPRAAWLAPGWPPEMIFSIIGDGKKHTAHRGKNPGSFRHVGGRISAFEVKRRGETICGRNCEKLRILIADSARLEIEMGVFQRSLMFP